MKRAKQKPSNRLQVLDTLDKIQHFYITGILAKFRSHRNKDIGNIRIGPWYYWLSANNWEFLVKV